MAAPRKLAIANDLLGRVIDGRAPLLCDGGMGTLIQQTGLARVHEVPDLLNLTHADEIRELQRRYVEAGSDCIATNTFSSNRLKLAGTDASVDELYAAATRIARETGAQLVAGDIGPTGKLLVPLGPLSFSEAYDIFAEQACAAHEAGCDLIFLETFADLLEAKAALLACVENTPLPVFATMTFGEDGRSFMGTTPAIAATTLSALGASAVGINCSLGPAETAPLVTQMAPYARCPLMVQPNAGLPRMDADGSTVYDVTPGEFAQAMRGILAAGARVIGGCCGTTPEHIAALRRLIDEDGETRGGQAGYRPSFVVTSAQSLVELAPGSDDIAVIGERINPTGKPRLKEALVDGSYDLIVSEAVGQVEAGAAILDVNVGVPGLDEPAVLRAVSERLQAPVPVPLQLDSSDASALEAACRTYAGRPLINSVNGKAEILEAILPIVKKYGAAVVGLAMDENGLPETAQQRFDLAERILNAALTHGIPKEDVIIDCLTLTVSAQQEQAQETLNAVRRVTEELGLHTMLGVSNISFGLPERMHITSNFLIQALHCGLDLPIVNPNQAAIMDAIAAFKVLSGEDKDSAAYIARFANAAPAPATQVDLETAVARGLKAECAQLTRALLETTAPLDIINQKLIPALDTVGKRYEKGEIFLPQLINSANASSEAFEVIKEHILAQGGQQVSKGKIILATVQGDIHDIGKNIVKVILENYGYQVIDLGRDVPPEKVVETAVTQDVSLIGLSALMTTTVPSMAATIDALKHSGHPCKTLVGGAVLTPEYATEIGADYYAKDAKQSADIAKEVLG